MGAIWAGDGDVRWVLRSGWITRVRVPVETDRGGSGLVGHEVQVSPVSSGRVLIGLERPRILATLALDQFDCPESGWWSGLPASATTAATSDGQGEQQRCDDLHEQSSQSGPS